MRVGLGRLYAEPCFFPEMPVRRVLCRAFYAESDGPVHSISTTAPCRCSSCSRRSRFGCACEQMHADLPVGSRARKGPDDRWTRSHTRKYERRASSATTPPPRRRAAVPRLLGELARALLGRALALAARARLLLFEVDARRPELVFPLLRLQPRDEAAQLAEFARLKRQTLALAHAQVEEPPLRPRDVVGVLGVVLDVALLDGEVLELLLVRVLLGPRRLRLARARLGEGAAARGGAHLGVQYC